MIVNNVFAAPTITVCSRALSVEAPMFSNIFGA